MTRPVVTIYHAVDTAGDSYARLEQAGAAVIVHSTPWASDIRGGSTQELVLDPATVAAAGVANRVTKVSGTSLAAAPGLRLIAKYSNGYDNVDLAAATEQGILVVNSPTEANWSGVAEGTMTSMLAMLKKVRERDRSVKEGAWRNPALTGTYVGSRISDGYEGITIGIIGFGRIGTRLADLFQPWRVTIIAFDPYVEPAKFARHNVRSVDLDTLLRTSDVVTLHCDLNQETWEIISSDALSKMKSEAILVNAARGSCVDVDALVEALLQDRIGGAVLDVLPQEPPDPQSPILGLGDKVLLSPHMVSATKGGGLLPAIPWVENEILAALRGDLPKHVVNPEAIPLWRERFEGKALI